MVHALTRVRRHLAPDGTLVLIQPRPLKRPFISVIAHGRRQKICALVNPDSEKRLNAALAAIDAVAANGLFAPIGKTDRHFRVRLANPTQLDRYLYSDLRPPRFPPGGRKRFMHVWKARPRGAEIEVTEFLAVMAMRPT
jgi:hypothetical protein